jgi:hypothetical protein
LRIGRRTSGSFDFSANRSFFSLIEIFRKSSRRISAIARSGLPRFLYTVRSGSIISLSPQERAQYGSF